MKTLFIVAITLGTLPVIAENKTDWYLVMPNGRPQYFQSMTADERGTIKGVSPGRTQSFTRRQYKVAVTPKPKGVKAAESRLSKGDFQGAVNVIEKVYDDRKWLGWGAHMAYLRGRCYLKLGNPDEAEAALRDGRKYPANGESRNRLGMLLVELLIEQDKLDEAENLVKKMRPTGPDDATPIYNARGKVLSARGKKDMAVLSYLKTILLYPNDPNAKYAYQQVVALLRELNDKRADDFQEELNRRYN